MVDEKPEEVKAGLFRVENLVLVAGIGVSYLSPIVASHFAPPVFLWLLTVLYSISLAQWLYHDMQRRHVRLWFDYGFFAYMLWFAFYPYYLFHTRGWRAFITICWFLGINLAFWLLTIWVLFTFFFRVK
jgi:hypothetical protein